MFVDSADIVISSGNGGAGAVSFRREKFIAQGGPDGGDGGSGGNIIFEVSHNTHTLSSFRGKKHYKATNGEAGKPKHCSGKSGKNLIIKVPLGTQIINLENNKILADFTESKRIVLLKGGKGGLGNARFKNATNQAPTYAQKGIAGVSLHIRLELKLIADVGLVGFPNVGKSSLISTLSNAKPEVANYEFTTITPHLGVVELDNLQSFVIADIPGIIEGASNGKGLGLAFLKHIERTKFLLLVLDCAREMSVKSQYEILKNELEIFSSALKTRPFGIVISKADTQDIDSLNIDIIAHSLGFFAFIKKGQILINKYLESIDSNALSCNEPYFMMPISSATHLYINELKFLLARILNAQNKH